MSPKLYNIYASSMIGVVRDSEAGIKVGTSYIGIIMYADDLTLTADSIDKMKILLEVVRRQGLIDDTKFNAKKSCLMLFSETFKLLSFYRLF